jgi:hypothetical protein
VHRRLGFASFSEYVERHFGYNGRLVKEKLRVAQALERLPQTSEALRAGELNWSAVRELTRVATPETEGAWLESSRGVTVRQVEEMVSGRGPGDLPSDPADPKLRKYNIHLELCAETRALFVEALAALRRQAGEALDDDAAMLMMSRQVLATLGSQSADSGRAGYQVQVNICKKCKHAEQIGNGEAHPIAPAVAEMVLCDAQVIDASDPTHVGQKAKTTIPRAIRRLVMLRDNRRCVVPGCTNSTFVQAHHLTARADGGRHDRTILGVFAARIIGQCTTSADCRGTAVDGAFIQARRWNALRGYARFECCGPQCAGFRGAQDDGLQGTRLPDGGRALLAGVAAHGYSGGDAACRAANASVIGC